MEMHTFENTLQKLQKEAGRRRKVS